MKRLFKLAFLVLLMVQVSSCGKTNNSGSSSSTSSDISTIGAGDFGFSDTDQVGTIGNYASVKSYYEGLSLSAGLSDGMYVYHTGSDFSSEEQKYMTNYSSTLVEYTDGYNTGSFDRNHNLYRKMLNLDNDIQIVRTQVSSAKITVRENGEYTYLTGELIEYFYTNGDVDRYVLSQNFPLVANPIGVVHDTVSNKELLGIDWLNYSQINTDITGRLNVSGTQEVIQIEVMLSQLDPNSGSVYIYRNYIF